MVSGVPALPTKAGLTDRTTYQVSSIPDGGALCRMGIGFHARKSLILFTPVCGIHVRWVCCQAHICSGLKWLKLRIVEVSELANKATQAHYTCEVKWVPTQTLVESDSRQQVESPGRTSAVDLIVLTAVVAIESTLL